MKLLCITKLLEIDSYSCKLCENCTEIPITARRIFAKLLPFLTLVMHRTGEGVARDKVLLHSVAGSRIEICQIIFLLLTCCVYFSSRPVFYGVIWYSIVEKIKFYAWFQEFEQRWGTFIFRSVCDMLCLFWNFLLLSMAFKMCFQGWASALSFSI